MNKIILPKGASYIISELNKRGFEAYIVGGCVRDYLLGKTPKDWDITTSALPEQVKATFSHTYDTGIEHGTVTVLIGKTGYEVTTYRIDGEYMDNRHPKSVVFTSKLEGDLARRDFTINAMAYNEDNGVVDKFGGLEDLKNGIIRAVREPEERFREDALRMMRALRFSAQLGFEIEEKTLQAIADNAHLIKNISGERIRDEMLKMLLSDNPLKIYELRAVGLTDNFMPLFSRILGEREKLIKDCLEKTHADAIKRLALIFHGLDFKDLQKVLKQLKLDNKTLKSVLTLSKYMNLEMDTGEYGIRKLISETSYDDVERIIYMRGIIGSDKQGNETMAVFEKIKQRGDCCFIKELAVDGNILMELGVPSGSEVGAMLKKCLDEVLRNPMNNNREYLIKEVCGLCMH